jgi:hypothetical protein
MPVTGRPDRTDSTAAVRIYKATALAQNESHHFAEKGNSSLFHRSVFGARLSGGQTGNKN